MQFEQDESLLIGTSDDIKKLKESEDASIAIISDSHGDAKNFLSVLKECENCAALIFCGDGANDLATVLNCASQNIKIPKVIAFVRGNNDMSSFAIKKSDGGLQLIKIPDKQILEVAEHKIFITHGHCFGISAGIQTLAYAAMENQCDVALFGHTHIATVAKNNDVVILNPGSIRLPRGGQPKTFAKIYLEKKRSPSDYAFFEISKDGIKSFKNPQVV